MHAQRGTSSASRGGTWRRTALVAALALVLSISGALGRKGFGDGGQEFGYVDVREGAHMFYWMYYVNGGEEPAGKPLVIWLQGGPGASSTSYGNFEEIGPLDAFLKKRDSTWVNHVNLLFIDNPVGTGYSYVDHYSQLTTNNKQIATDLVEFTKSFMTTYPKFQTVPLYIFCESYGGKMVAEFALNLYKEQKAGNVSSNLKGVALGDSWISPVDSVMTWAPFLLHTGMVDRRGYEALDEVARRIKRATESGQYFHAAQYEAQAEILLTEVTDGGDLLNILNKIPAERAAGLRRAAERGDYQEILFRNHVARDSGVDLDKLMDEKVKPALGVIPKDVHHTYSSYEVFGALSPDFMKPVIHIVEQLLSDTDVQVAVVSGQLDLIVDTPGTLAWAERLNWTMGEYWVNSAVRKPLVVNGIIEGFVKSVSNGKFSFYWINRAGHMVPSDNPAAGIEVLKLVTGLKKT